MRPTSPHFASLRLAVAAALGIPVAFLGCDGATTVVCESPEEGASGFVTCANGLVTRPAAVTCESDLPRDQVCQGDPEFDQCQTDADCTEFPNGACGVASGDPFGDPFPGCSCSYGCVTDDDCGDGAICACASPVGQCINAECRTDAECDDGQLCAGWDSLDECGGGGFACTTGDDECLSHSDCSDGQSCEYQAGKRSCVQIEPCAIGRPFLIDDEPRLAEAVLRDDWSLRAKHDAAALDADMRSALADRWLEVARMEHASIAAFARFTLQLLALGAPGELVASSAKAGADETRHARLAFGMVKAFGGVAVGPGPLGLEGALGDVVDHEELLRVVYREGCVGETIAALEAREGQSRSGLAIFASIAADESDHATLAWASTKWLAEQIGPRAAYILAEELERATARSVPFVRGEPELSAFGFLTSFEREALRSDAIESLVRPATVALMARLTTQFEEQAPLSVH